MAKYYNGIHYTLDEVNHQVILMDKFQEQLLGTNKFLKFKKPRRFINIKYFDARSF